MKKITTTIIALATIFSVISCGSNNTPKTTEGSEIATTTEQVAKDTIVSFTGEKAVEYIQENSWKLTKLNGAENTEFATDAESFTIQFLPENKLAGTGACNRFNGEYTISNSDELKITMGGATRMACPNLNLEQDFFKALSEATKYTVSIDTLTISNGENAVAEFSRK